MGGPQTLPHYPMGWAMVSNTPLRLYKINTHQGGHQVPFIVHWPAGLDARGEIRTQYQHITDLMPTLAEITGVDCSHGEDTGSLCPEPAGASFAPSLNDADTDVDPSRAVLRDDRSPRVLPRWLVGGDLPSAPHRLLRGDVGAPRPLAADPTESRDVAAENPEKLAELQDAWEEAAWANQVYPLDEGNAVKMIHASAMDCRAARGPDPDSHRAHPPSSGGAHSS